MLTSLTAVSGNFQREVEARSGQNLDGCLGCGTCTGSCPNISFYDYSPRELIALIRRGEKKRVLESRSIWFCLGCYTCEERCPGGIGLSRVMDVCRELCLKEKYAVNGERVLLFHRLFLAQLARYGRAPEALLALQFNFQTRDYFRDLGLGRKMFLKGKIKLFPERISGQKEIRSFFREAGPRGVLPE